MQKVFWRISYAWQTLRSKLSGGPADLGVAAFFLTPGGLRAKLFGPTYVARRFLQQFQIGDCVRSGSTIELTIADVTLTIPAHGFEQGDVFDIALPYAIARNPELGERVAPYLAANTNRFYDGPYVTPRTPLVPGSVVIDAGASVGLFTITASKLLGDGGRVIAFEPIAEARELLEKNIAQNHCTNVTVVSAALGEETKMVQLDVSLGDHFEGSSKYIARGGTKREVQQYALDEYVEQQSVGTISFLKADIEGSERDLLTGAMRTLSLCHPYLAIRTYHLPDDREVLSALVDKVGGYQYEIVQGTTLHGWKT